MNASCESFCGCVCEYDIKCKRISSAFDVSLRRSSGGLFIGYALLEDEQRI